MDSFLKIQIQITFFSELDPDPDSFESVDPDSNSFGSVNPDPKVYNKGKS